jgi:hypothetical protein
VCVKLIGVDKLMGQAEDAYCRSQAFSMLTSLVGRKDNGEHSSVSESDSFETGFPFGGTLQAKAKSTAASGRIFDDDESKELELKEMRLTSMYFTGGTE